MCWDNFFQASSHHMRKLLSVALDKQLAFTVYRPDDSEDTNKILLGTIFTGPRPHWFLRLLHMRSTCQKITIIIKEGCNLSISAPLFISYSEQYFAGALTTALLMVELAGTFVASCQPPPVMFEGWRKGRRGAGVMRRICYECMPDKLQGSV